MTKRKPFDLHRALDEVRCPTCEACKWTVRVTALGPSGRPNDITFSQYACDGCVAHVLAVVRRVHPGAEVFPLPGRTAEPDPQPSLFEGVAS